MCGQYSSISPYINIILGYSYFIFLCDVYLFRYCQRVITSLFNCLFCSPLTYLSKMYFSKRNPMAVPFSLLSSMFKPSVRLQTFSLPPSQPSCPLKIDCLPATYLFVCFLYELLLSDSPS